MKELNWWENKLNCEKCKKKFVNKTNIHLKCNRIKKCSEIDAWTVKTRKNREHKDWTNLNFEDKVQRSVKMPKIFLIKNRLHQQQLRLLESQNLIQAKNEDRLNIGDNSHDDREPLSLVAKKRNTEDNSASSQQIADELQRRNDSGELKVLNFLNKKNRVEVFKKSN